MIWCKLSNNLVVNVLYLIFFFCYGIIKGHICHRLKKLHVSPSLLFKVVADMWGKLIAANTLLIALSPRPQNEEV